MCTALRIASSVYSLLRRSVAMYAPESGAIIASPADDPSYITRAWFDEAAGTGKEFYIPSGPQINAVVRQWADSQHRFIGVVHSHGDGFPELSPIDLRSAAAIMRANGMPFLYLGLFHRGELSVFKILVDETGTPRKEKLELIIEPPIPSPCKGELS